MDCKLYRNSVAKTVEENLLRVLTSSEEFKSRRIAESPRAVGDSVQDIVRESLYDCFPPNILAEYNADFARRAMADLAFTDCDGNYYIIDVKTHNKSTQFNMPNITSVYRLARFYEDDKNYFVILLVEYTVTDGILRFDAVRLIPLEALSWKCLSIGALGWGQIQITNANAICLELVPDRKRWMLSLCDALEILYPREIEKIQERQTHFSKVRKFWEEKP